MVQITEIMKDAKQSASEASCDDAPPHMSIIRRLFFFLDGVLDCSSFNTIHYFHYPDSIWSTTLENEYGKCVNILCVKFLAERGSFVYYMWLVLLTAYMYYTIAFTPLPFLSHLSYAFFDKIKFGRRNSFSVVLFMHIKLSLWSEFNFSMSLWMERMVSILVEFNKSVSIPNCVSNGYFFARGYWVTDWL